MTEPKRALKRDQKPIKTVYVTGTLKCGSCAYTWFVTDLNPHHKAVKCSCCGQLNDISKAAQRAA